MTITKAQTEKIRAIMAERYGDDVVVDFCMRYGNPSTRSKVEALTAQGCRRIVFFPLYPQYAGATTATANDQFFRALMEEKWQPSVRTVPEYFDRVFLINTTRVAEGTVAEAFTEANLHTAYGGRLATARMGAAG